MVQDQKNSARGKLVVVALLSISAIAGLGAIYYWSTWVVVVDPYGVGVKGNSSMTHQQIKDRFDRLSVGINEAMGGTSKLSDVVMSRVVAFVDDHPNHAGGYRLLGQALLENGRRKDAYRSWTRSLELNQEDEHRAELLINTGTLALELAGALDDQLMPKEILKDEVKRAKWLKEQSKERERLLKATELYYGEAIKLDNGSPRYYFFLGSLFMKQERFDQAEEMLDQALELDSTLFAAHYLMSQIYLKQDNYQRAIQSLNDAIDHVPDTKRDLQVLYLLDKSRVLRMDDRIEESLQVLTESLTTTEKY
jgi:tetratricopeptide (TPR) repeat protein